MLKLRGYYHNNTKILSSCHLPSDDSFNCQILVHKNGALKNFNARAKVHKFTNKYDNLVMSKWHKLQEIKILIKINI